MGKVDIVKRGLLGLTKLFDEAPPPQLPAVQKKTPLATLPDPEDTKTGSGLAPLDLLKRVLGSQLDRRQFMGHTARSALLNTTPLNLLSKLLPAPSGSSKSELLDEVMGLFEWDKGALSPPGGAYVGVPTGTFLKELMNRKFSKNQLEKFLDDHHTFMSEQGYTSDEMIQDIAEEAYYDGESGPKTVAIDNYMGGHDDQGKNKAVGNQNPIMKFMVDEMQIRDVTPETAEQIGELLKTHRFEYDHGRIDYGIEDWYGIGGRYPEPHVDSGSFSTPEIKAEQKVAHNEWLGGLNEVIHQNAAHNQKLIHGGGVAESPVARDIEEDVEGALTSLGTPDEEIEVTRRISTDIEDDVARDIPTIADVKYEVGESIQGAKDVVQRSGESIEKIFTDAVGTPLSRRSFMQNLFGSVLPRVGDLPPLEQLAQLPSPLPSGSSKSELLDKVMGMFEFNKGELGLHQQYGAPVGSLLKKVLDQKFTKKQLEEFLDKHETFKTESGWTEEDLVSGTFPKGEDWESPGAKAQALDNYLGGSMASQDYEVGNTDPVMRFMVDEMQEHELEDSTSQQISDLLKTHRFEEGDDYGLEEFYDMAVESEPWKDPPNFAGTNLSPPGLRESQRQRHDAWAEGLNEVMAQNAAHNKKPD